MTLSKTVPARGKVSATPAMARAGWTVHAIAICLLAYLASSSLVNLTGMTLRRLGMTPADAVMAASMAGFLYLWFIALWAFSRRSALRTWLCMAGLACLAFLATWMMGAAS